MITLRNVYQIDFCEEFSGVSIPHSVLFNISHISINEVKKLISSDAWEEDDRLIKLKPKQIKYLCDK